MYIVCLFFIIIIIIIGKSHFQPASQSRAKTGVSYQTLQSLGDRKLYQIAR